MAGKNGFLHYKFPIGIGEHFAAHTGVFAFGIFADHEEINVTGFAISERARYAGQQTDGA